MWIWFWTAVTGAFAQAPVVTDPGAMDDDRRGLGAPDDETIRPIINGTRGRGAEWPETGGLIVEAQLEIGGLLSVDARLLLCSATLIAPDVVLTAAHCIDIDGLTQEGNNQGLEIFSFSDLSFAFAPRVDLTPYQNQFGFEGMFEQPLPANAARGSAWVAHEDFDIATLELGLAENADVGLIFLDEPYLERDFALLPTAEEGAALAVDDDVVIVGWGQQAQDGISGTKQVADSFIAELGPYELKVGEIATDGRKCHGDSGGPSFRAFDDGWRLIGVTSHAYDQTDCRETGGVDTRVDAYLDWIDTEMRLACEDGRRTWCETAGIIAPPNDRGEFAWEETGCGCATGAAPGAGLLVLLLPWLARRRSHRDGALAEA